MRERHCDSPRKHYTRAMDTENESDEGQREDPSMPLLGKVRHLVTVEPAAFLYKMGYMFLFLTNEQYVYARMLEITAAKYADVSSMTSQNVSVIMECGKMDETSQIEDEADGAAARFLTLYTAIYEVPCVLLAFLWGSYTDSVGRKKALILPVLGSLIRALVNLTVAATRINLAVLYVGCAIEGLFGGPAVFTGAVFAYIADVTTKGSRSQRTVIIQAMLVFGLALSQIIQGYLVQYLGFVFTYIFTAGAIGLNLLYVSFWVLESVEDIKPCSFFRLDHVKKTVLLFFRDDGTHRLRKMQVVFGILGIHHFVVTGAFPILILFMISAPFCISPTLLGAWLAFSNILNGTGVVVVTFLFKAISDLVLLIIANAMALIAHAWLAAPFLTVGLFFVAPVLNFMASAIVPLSQAALSKATNQNEQGALSAGLVICCEVCGLIGTTVFGPIYANTLSFYKGTVWLVAVVFLIPPLLLSIYLWRHATTKIADPEPSEDTRLSEQK